jgi:hypothetical protein
MKELGANVVRIHLQLAKFMDAPDKPNEKSLERLSRLLQVSERTGLYLDITGLACYHKKDVPQWYDSMDEAGRWNIQAHFWRAIAEKCADSNAVFCYDLMNEPMLPGPGEMATDWLGPDFDGKRFMQYITLELAQRTREQVAQAWVEKLVFAIRSQDKRHMKTVGTVAWVQTFPSAKPLFYSQQVGKNLDFVSVHFYPQKDKIEESLKALRIYDLGKPLVIEEISPLYCGIEQFDVFINNAKSIADGFIGFYWGSTIKDYSRNPGDLRSGIMKEWLQYFLAKRPQILIFPDGNEPISLNSKD